MRGYLAGTPTHCSMSFQANKSNPCGSCRAVSTYARPGPSQWSREGIPAVHSGIRSRHGSLLSSPIHHGCGDVDLDINVFYTYRGFCNKIWNISKVGIAGDFVPSKQRALSTNEALDSPRGELDCEGSPRALEQKNFMKSGQPHLYLLVLPARKEAPGVGRPDARLYMFVVQVWRLHRELQGLDPGGAWGSDKLHAPEAPSLSLMKSRPFSPTPSIHFGIVHHPPPLFHDEAWGLKQ